MSVYEKTHEVYVTGHYSSNAAVREAIAEFYTIETDSPEVVSDAQEGIIRMTVKTLAFTDRYEHTVVYATATKGINDVGWHVTLYKPKNECEKRFENWY